MATPSRTLTTVAFAEMGATACGAATALFVEDPPQDAAAFGTKETDAAIDASVDATIHGTVDAAVDATHEVLGDTLGPGDARRDVDAADAPDARVCGHPCGGATCSATSAVCGPTSDGCGGLIDCGACPSDRPYCLTFVCAAEPPPCAPRTCAQLDANCGFANDGCGDVLQCGDCADGEACGAIVPGHCDPCPGPPPDAGADAPVDSAPRLVCGVPCAPKTCADFPPAGCATLEQNDGCGGQIRCNQTVICGGATSCCGPSGGTCYAPFPDAGPFACGDCVPKRCADLGPEACGPVADGCGGLLDCGACTGGRICLGGQCGPCPSDAH